MNHGRIVKVSGPLVVAEGMQNADMFDVVRVGDQGLIGEIIEMRGDAASIQVYEETAGLGPGTKVVTTGVPLSVELGPGMIENIYDGIQRPLKEMLEISGSNITRGINVNALPRDKKWSFVPTKEAGEKVEAGDIIGTVQETVSVGLKIMVPYGIEGVIKDIKGGDYTVEDIVCVVEKADGTLVDITMMQKWPV
ncbi:MAG: V-type ATP synthase subunit A, partial [Anaerovoracaceae bacterium]